MSISYRLTLSEHNSQVFHSISEVAHAIESYLSTHKAESPSVTIEKNGAPFTHKEFKQIAHSAIRKQVAHLTLKGEVKNLVIATDLYQKAATVHWLQSDISLVVTRNGKTVFEDKNLASQLQSASQSFHIPPKPITRITSLFPRLSDVISRMSADAHDQVEPKVPSTKSSNNKKK